MRNLSLLFMVSILSLSAGCSSTPDRTEKSLTIVNAASLDSDRLDAVRLFVASQLQIPVRLIEEPRLSEENSFQTLEKVAEQYRHELDVIYVVIANVEGARHLAVYEDSRVAVINSRALYTEDAKRFYRRIERQVMRAAAFCVGLPPTPDPFCVTRNYKSLEDLDQMGRNYSPPWQGRFAQEAGELGLLTDQAEGGPKGGGSR